jgi:predicted metal-dependent hydrolase
VVRQDGRLEVRAPLRYNAKTLDEFVEQKSEWIRKALEKRAKAILIPAYDAQEYQRIRTHTTAKAEAFIKNYPGKKPIRLSVRRQRSVWGTCNSKGVIAINALAGLLPDHLFTYIMIHELSHLEVMNHSVFFWNLVSYYVPEWKACRAELKNYRISK